MKDENDRRKLVRKEVSDEEVCPKCQKKISECECEKHQGTHDEKIEKLEISKEQFEALKELIELLPELKKLAEKEKEDPKKEKKEESEEEEPEESAPKGDSEDFDPEVILEGEGDDKEIVSEEFDLNEEDVIDDEGGNGINDSALNPGTIEKLASNSNKDAVSHETEVAEAWSQRYEALLKNK